MEIAMYIIAAIILVAFLVFMFIYRRNVLKEWIYQAVVLAEKELGSGRGQEKLALVHTRLVERFPIVGRVLPFSIFSAMVDTALELMRKNLEESRD